MQGQRGHRATRESDERLLIWLRMRCNGISIGKIAAQYRVSRALVYEQTSGVMNHDIEHCGKKVAKHYW